jgi:hypothetical protein
LKIDDNEKFMEEWGIIRQKGRTWFIVSRAAIFSIGTVGGSTILNSLITPYNGIPLKMYNPIFNPKILFMTLSLFVIGLVASLLRWNKSEKRYH